MGFKEDLEAELDSFTQNDPATNALFSAAIEKVIDDYYYPKGSNPGVSGTFQTADLKQVVVEDGIITKIFLI